MCRFRILPLIALYVITGLATFGYVNIPMAMSGELFPLETKVAATRFDMVLLPGSKGCLLPILFKMIDIPTPLWHFSAL